MRLSPVHLGVWVRTPKNQLTVGIAHAYHDHYCGTRLTWYKTKLYSKELLPLKNIPHVFVYCVVLVVGKYSRW